MSHHLSTDNIFDRQYYNNPMTIEAIESYPELTSSFLSQNNINRVCQHVEYIVSEHTKHPYRNINKQFVFETMESLLGQHVRRHLDSTNLHANFSHQAKNLGKHYIVEKDLREAYQNLQHKERKPIIGVDDLSAIAIAKIAERVIARVEELRMYNKFLYNLDDQKPYSNVVIKNKSEPKKILNYGIDRIIP